MKIENLLTAVDNQWIILVKYFKLLQAESRGFSNLLILNFKITILAKNYNKDIKKLRSPSYTVTDPKYDFIDFSWDP